MFCIYLLRFIVLLKINGIVNAYSASCSFLAVICSGNGTKLIHGDKDLSHFFVSVTRNSLVKLLCGLFKPVIGQSLKPEPHMGKDLDYFIHGYIPRA